MRHCRGRSAVQRPHTLITCMIRAARAAPSSCSTAAGCADAGGCGCSRPAAPAGVCLEGLLLPVCAGMLAPGAALELVPLLAACAAAAPARLTLLLGARLARSSAAFLLRMPRFKPRPLLPVLPAAMLPVDAPRTCTRHRRATVVGLARRLVFCWVCVRINAGKSRVGRHAGC